MPKLKTKSGVKKRFKLTATGKVKHGVAGKRHRLISHNSKYIRTNRGTTVLAEADTARVKRVGLMLARKVDPKLRTDVAELIKDLGNTDYVRREQAEDNLFKLGRLAVPELKKALKDMDPEVMTRAERLLLELKEQLDAP